MAQLDKYTVKNKFLRVVMGNYTKWQSGLNVEYTSAALHMERCWKYNFNLFSKKEHSIFIDYRFMRIDTLRPVQKMPLISIVKTKVK